MAFAVVWRSPVVVQPQVALRRRGTSPRRLIKGDDDVGRHEDKDKADEQRIIESNGHRPGRDLPPEDPGGKHGKPDDADQDE